jgi:hypothetical protein
MHPVVAIRTHQWGEAEERLRAQLQPVFGDDLCVVFHNRPQDITLGAAAITFYMRCVRRFPVTAIIG